MKKLFIFLLIPFCVEGQDSTTYRYSAEEGWIKTTYSKWWELKPNGDTTYYTEETEITHQDNPYIKTDTTVLVVKSPSIPRVWVKPTYVQTNTNRAIFLTKYNSNTHNVYDTTIQYKSKWHIPKTKKVIKPKKEDVVNVIFYKNYLFIVNGTHVVEAPSKKKALRKLGLKWGKIIHLTDNSIIR